MLSCFDDAEAHMDSSRLKRQGMVLKLWWWVRVLPPPGSLIWRFPGLIRPRCTAGATHRNAESYYGVKVHQISLSALSLNRCPLRQNRLDLLIFRHRSWDKDKTRHKSAKATPVLD